ncbi:MAG: hypothetical protein CL916_02895 [Deltaproteobacteria bacterium]|nr:hypothetical protein [Deltaproteobacteria bacterium]
MITNEEKYRLLVNFLWSVKNQAHRDLSFLIASPSLLKNTATVPAISSTEWWNLFVSSMDAIKKDDSSPQRLNDFVDTQRQYKLGLYAEDLFLYFLDNFSEYEILVHDMQVFIDKRSIGAFDFIVKAKDGTIEHWEMAIKYFVQYRPSPSWIDFIGPGGKDSLYRKMNKMLGRQILLGDRIPAQEGLVKKGIPLPQKKRIVSMGKLFSHFGTQFIPPVDGDPNQPTGCWAFLHQFVEYIKNDKEHRWAYRKHPYWIAPILTKNEDELMNQKEVSIFVEEQEKHVMLSELKKTKKGWEECQRWFVMPNNWKKVEK